MAKNPPQPLKRRPRPVSRFKRSEATRLLQGVLDAGVPVRGVEVDHVTGDLRVLVGKPDEAATTALDQWQAGRADQT
jgi:hypothetical protein